MRKCAARTLVFVLIMLCISLQAYSLDYPHNSVNNIGCSSCHYVYADEPSYLPPWTNHTPADIDDTQYNALCWSCHNDSTAPYVRTHSSLQIDSDYGNWAVECKTCHNPHYQKQVLSYGDVSHLYSGISTDIQTDVPVAGKSQLTKTTAGWTVDQFAPYVGDDIYYVLLPNISKSNKRFGYKILSNTADTITVEGMITGATVGVDTFAITYGKLIKNTIKLDDIIGANPPKSGDKTVKFINTTGVDSFADGNATLVGVCEVCHTKTLYHRNDATGDQSHNPTARCTDCHLHTKGFKPVCDICHGEPPVVNVANGGPSGLVSKNGTTGSTTAGAHDLHVNVENFSCPTCHYNHIADSKHNVDFTVTLGFSLFGTYNGGSYDGQTNVVYNSSEINTTVDNTGAMTCTNLYCHGMINGSKWGSGMDTAPKWNSSYVNCGSCHLADSANTPTLGSHFTHTSGTRLTLACTICHENYTNVHVNNEANVSFSSTDGRVNGGSYNGTLTMLDAYGQCSNIYCHGAGTPTWGDSIQCDGCHGYPPVSKDGLDINEQYDGGKGAHLMSWSSRLHVDTSKLDSANDVYGDMNTGYSECAKCHGGRFDGMVSGSNHGNGTVDIIILDEMEESYSFDGMNPPMYQGFPGDINTPKTCFNVSCHFKETPRWSCTGEE